MTDASGRSAASFEEILSAVEQDEGLRKVTGQMMTDETMNTGHGSAEADGGAALGGIGALLSRPELIAKLPALMNAVKTLSEPSPAPSHQRPQTPEALLCALRPYLSDSRQKAVDTMIRLAKLSESLKLLQ